MKTKESAEMYLETILILKNEQPVVRAIDIVRYTGYTKPSISRGLSLLKKNKHIEVAENGYITLTDSGLAIASKILERHQILTQLLIRLGIDPGIAADDACKIEHVISDESFEKIKEHAHKH